MEQANAAKEVLRLKKEYDSNMKSDPNFYKTDTAKQLGSSAKQIREQYGLDESRYGANVNMIDSINNYMNDYGSQQGQSQQQRPQEVEQSRPNRIDTGDLDRRYQDMQGMFQENSDAYYESQKAQFDKILNDQLTQLEIAYNEAVNQGELSINEAKEQFLKAKEELEKNAYAQSEATKMHSQNRGIQNSQQFIGLMQGDNARANSLHNSNLKDRDSRVNSIKDRIKMIGKEKDLNINKANLEHGYNLAGADAEAKQMYAKQMSDLSQQDYFTRMGMEHDYNMSDIQQQYAKENMDKQQQYAKENMDKQQGYNRENMAIEQGYKKDNMKIEFENRFKELSEQSRLRINEMTVGHGFDMKKMEQSLKDSITMAGVNYRHSSSLNAQQNKARMNEISVNAMKAIEAEQRAYDLSVKRESAKYNPNTPEGKIFLNQKNAKINDIMSMSILEAEMGNIFNDEALSGKPKSPKDYTANSPLGKYDPVGSVLNKFTGYNKDSARYEAENKAYLDAIMRKDSFMRKYTPGMGSSAWDSLSIDDKFNSLRE